jgi:DNA-binding NarL/FixJ family response regulator
MGAIIASTFYLPPFGQPSVGEFSDAIRVGLFVVEGSGAAVLGEIIHRSLARQDELSSGTARVRQLLRLPGAARMMSAVEPLVEPLTDRELEVIRLAALGLRNSEIAATLYVSGNTVKTHLAHAFGKLAVSTRTEAVARCAALGLLELPDDPPGTASDGADPERARSGSNAR